MSDTSRITRVAMPATAKRGEVITIKTMIQHDMETGYRRDAQGQVIPRDIVTKFFVLYEGEEIFRAETGSGISANPFFSFTTIATNTGSLVFTWVDLAGRTTLQTKTLTVT